MSPHRHETPPLTPYTTRTQLLTVKEYAHRVGQHPRSIYRRIWEGRQPGAVRVGGQWRIDAAPGPMFTNA